MNRPRTGRFFTIYRSVSIAISALAIGYLLLLNFPQPLFAHSIAHNGFRVYSREPIRPELSSVLEKAEARLRRSTIYDAESPRHVYMTDSFGMYALLSHKAYRSFANSVPFIENIIVNNSDVPGDRVFIDRAFSNSRSLSGVIAHEVTHLFIQRKYGTLKSMTLPTWKKEGYCEYIAGDTTIPIEEGIRRWRDDPTDDSTYRYIKYQLMVEHLLEKEQISVDQLFNEAFDEREVAERTLAGLSGEQR